MAVVYLAGFSAHTGCYEHTHAWMLTRSCARSPPDMLLASSRCNHLRLHAGDHAYRGL